MLKSYSVRAETLSVVVVEALFTSVHDLPLPAAPHNAAAASSTSSTATTATTAAAVPSTTATAAGASVPLKDRQLHRAQFLEWVHTSTLFQPFAAFRDALAVDEFRC